MSCLTAVITHLPARQVDAHMAYLEALAPRSRFLICHGGARDEFERLSGGPAVFVDDPSLRGSIDDQSYDEVLRAAWSAIEDDASVERVLLLEYDHLVLCADFEQRLAAVAAASGADFIAKHCAEYSDSNWFHYHRWRDDPALNEYFAAISRREDKSRRYGCLGSGMLVGREALAAFATLPPPPPCYLELFIPTAMHHLGFSVDDADRVSDIYAGVRWRPEVSVAEAVAAKRSGRAFVHPFKRLDALDAVARA